MPIYITGPSTGRLTITAFEERDLKGRGPSTVDTSGIFVFPAKPMDSSFLEVMNDIASYTASTIFNQPVSNPPPFNNVSKAFPIFPMNPPTVMINVKGINDTDEFKSLGLREEISVDFPGKWMISSSMSLEDLRKLWTMGIDLKGPSLAGNVNPAGLLAFYYAWKAIGIFQVTVGGRKSKSFESMKVIDTGIEDGKELVAGVPMIGGDQTLIITTEVKEKKTDGKEKIFDKSRFSTVVAPVASDFSRVSFTSKSSDPVPKEMGFVFEYFDEMLIGSKDFVAGVFFRYFSRCIVDKPEELEGLAPILRRGFVDMFTSNAGKVLQHIFFGIQSAVETGSLFRIIVDRGTYRGFVLLGKNIRVLVNGAVEVPREYGIIKGEVEALDTHRFAVERIVETLAGLEMKTSGSSSLDGLDAELMSTNSRYMAKQIYRRKVAGESVEEEVLKDAILKLRYGDTYWIPNSANTLQIMRCIMMGQIADNEPFYLGGGTVFSDNSIVRILSVFGPTAPTLSVRTGTKNIAICPPEATDPNLQVIGKTTKLPYLPIYSRNLNDAADMWDALRRTKVLKVMAAKAKSAGKFVDRTADIGHVSGKEFHDLYALLRTWCHASGGSSKRTKEMTAEEILEDAERLAKKKATERNISSMF
jgi:hypothetical protein